MSGTQRHVGQGAQKGIIILEGAYVRAVQDYHGIAGDSRWWFTNLNTARCKKEFLLTQGLWKRPHSTTESVHLAEVEEGKPSPLAYVLPRRALGREHVGLR